MQDPRLRLFSITVLSIASFVSVAGAAFSLLWLCLYPAYLKAAVQSAGFWILALLTGAVSAVTFLTGGDAIPYFFRMTVVFLLAYTIYRGWSPGEYLDLSVWLFGDRTGFDIGLTIEMSLQGLKDAFRDWGRMQVALRLKGLRPGFRTVPVLGFLLVQTRLMRARDQADLLVSRGYVRGGTCCPRFHTPQKDLAASVLAVLVLALALLPLRDIFILLVERF